MGTLFSVGRQMLFPYALRFSNFRSIRDELHIPFSKKITYVVGPNNIGKSNVLRFLALFFNKAETKLEDIYDFHSPTKKVALSICVDKPYLESSLVQQREARSALKFSNVERATLYYDMSKNALSSGSIDDHKELFSIFNNEYFSQKFLHDFGQSSSIEANKSMFLGRLSISNKLSGTTYLPNVRFITEPGKEPPQFAKMSIPGETVAFGEVIDRFAQMDRPTFEDRELRERLKQICDFISFCLEKKAVGIQVPREKNTILVEIDGDERPIASLGTGVEQLMMIGLASIGFPGKLVLIDEPELHLHPRAQKRVMKYLSDSVDAQFVIATHSAAVLDAVDADIVQILHEDDKTIGRSITSNAERFRAVRDLGHSPSELLQTKFAIWVEGPSDRIYLKHWISKMDETLIEGIDYSILFYGGKVLSHHSFLDGDSDLVKAVSLSRSFAVVIDSDRKPDKPNLNSTKSRIKEEVEKEGGLCWITDGREIENYIPDEVIHLLAIDIPGVVVPADKRQQVLDPEKVKKTEFARRAIAVKSDEWPLDLKRAMTDLVYRIHQAK